MGVRLLVCPRWPPGRRVRSVSSRLALLKSVPGAFLLPPSYRRCSRESRRVFARREGVNRYPSLTLKLSSTAASRQQRVACRRRSSANVPRSFSFFLSFSFVILVSWLVSQLLVSFV